MRGEPVYPVIVFSNNDNMIYVYFNERKLKSTSEALLKKIDYKKLELFDASGHQYKITEAFKVKFLGLWGFNPILKGRQILIDFKYDPVIEDISFEDFKRNIVIRLENNKRFWESGWDIEELKQKIYETTTFIEIAELLK
ncbi:MAG: hypothetical protein H7289_14300 [Mucilaginibacter sp.]|nr:hypothetical protein [Mucilaginibacter sp.]